jgi:hypothetical protein
MMFFPEYSRKWFSVTFLGKDAFNIKFVVEDQEKERRGQTTRKRIN